MLVNATEMLKKAKAGHYAVGQFNINNLEWTKAVLLTAQELQSPVILGVSEGAGKYMTCLLYTSGKYRKCYSSYARKYIHIRKQRCPHVITEHACHRNDMQHTGAEYSRCV